MDITPNSSAWESYRSCRRRVRAFGMINALGATTDEVLQSIYAARPNFTRRGDLVTGQDVQVGAVGWELPELPERLARYRFRNSQLLLAAFAQIEREVADAVERFGPERVGVVGGSSTAGIAVNEEAVEIALTEGGSIGARAHLYQEMASVAELLGEHAGLKGPCYTISTACSSSTKVFAAAKRLLDLGICDAVIAGGADTLSKLTVSGFASLQLLTQGESNPFSKNRSGIVIGEGAALFLVTREAGGIQILGVGESSDAYHFSAPDPSGAGAEAAMRRALTDAGVAAADICYINLHGTGTPPNDKMEAQAVAKVFEQPVAASSTKPLTGHLLGASGATEIAICAAVLAAPGSQMQLPPHLWDGVPDPELPELPFVSRDLPVPRPELALMLSNSFAFGGSNASVVLGATTGA